MMWSYGQSITTKSFDIYTEPQWRYGENIIHHVYALKEPVELSNGIMFTAEFKEQIMYGAQFSNGAMFQVEFK